MEVIVDALYQNTSYVVGDILHLILVLGRL